MRVFVLICNIKLRVAHRVVQVLVIYPLLGNKVIPLIWIFKVGKICRSVDFILVICNIHLIIFWFLERLLQSLVYISLHIPVWTFSLTSEDFLNWLRFVVLRYGEILILSVFRIFDGLRDAVALKASVNLGLDFPASWLQTLVGHPSGLILRVALRTSGRHNLTSLASRNRWIRWLFSHKLRWLLDQEIGMGAFGLRLLCQLALKLILGGNGLPSLVDHHPLLGSHWLPLNLAWFRGRRLSRLKDTHVRVELVILLLKLLLDSLLVKSYLLLVWSFCGCCSGSPIFEIVNF